MIAIGLDFEQHRLAHREQAPPHEPSGTEVLWRVREVGVCGTDRELAAFRRGQPPADDNFLVIGHEAVGEVVGVGPTVTRFHRGDWVAPTIRRGCKPACEQCGRNRRDLCVTGAYTERGIFGEHGYFSELALDDEADLVAIPAAMSAYGVLLEPLSVVEKALDTALRVHPASPRSALIFGAGPIGILAAMAAQARGLDVTVTSLEPEDGPRAALLRRAGVRYCQNAAERSDVVIEAAGATEAGFRALSLLKPNGVCGVLGAKNGDGTVPFLDLILGNQIVFGSVNASPAAFEAAARDLPRFDRGVLDGLIHRTGWRNYPGLLLPPSQDIKLVHVWDDHLN